MNEKEQELYKRAEKIKKMFGNSVFEEETTVDCIRFRKNGIPMAIHSPVVYKMPPNRYLVLAEEIVFSPEYEKIVAQVLENPIDSCQENQKDAPNNQPDYNIVEELDS